MDDRRYEELARRLADYPGRWIPWPVGFATRAEADRLFEPLRDGGRETFKVDSAAFRWRVDEFRTIVDEHGLVWMEVSCAWRGTGRRIDDGGEAND